MRTLIRSLCVAVALLMSTAAADATDVYVVQGRARGSQIGDGFGICEAIQWSTDVAFYNKGDSAAQVIVVGVSNGAAGVPSGDVLSIPSHKSLSLIGKRPQWRAVTNDPLWVLHLDVPPEIQLESTLWIGVYYQCVEILPSPFRFGQVRLPVVYSLTPAAQEQAHLVTGVGGDLFKGRLNVGIYNAAALEATATIEIRQHCNNVTIDRRTVSISPNTLTQVGGFSAQPAQFLPEDPRRCQGPPFDGTVGVYTVVTVDQPSFSFVSAVADNATPMASIGITW